MPWGLQVGAWRYTFNTPFEMRTMRRRFLRGPPYTSFNTPFEMQLERRIREAETNQNKLSILRLRCQLSHRVSNLLGELWVSFNTPFEMPAAYVTYTSSRRLELLSILRLRCHCVEV